jgi:hypothetical protein
LEVRLGRFAVSYPGYIDNITGSQIDGWLRGLKSLARTKKGQGIAGKTRNNYRNAIVELFNYARKNGYLPKDLGTEAAGTTRVHEIKKDNEIFLPDQMDDLLNVAPVRMVPGIHSLRPKDVREALTRKHVSSRKRYARKNRAFRRQGEWFFVPEPSFVVDEKLVLRNEPLRRGSGKPHLVEEIFRSGGETVHVCRRHPNGVTPDEYRSILQRSPEAAGWGWQVMRRNPGVYARGTVRHSDHATITLPFWHRVMMNTETQSRTMANVAFLD